MTDLAVRNGFAPATAAAAALAIQPGQTMWDDFQNAALGQLGLKTAPNGDKAVFLHVCQRTGLDPFARQIYMIERREKQGNEWVSKWTIQTGIEGWRVIRDRAERREGVRGIPGRFIYYDASGDERKVWVSPQPPAAVEFTYTVRDRNGIETPYTSVLRFAEYIQTREKDGQRVPVSQWATKPVHMLEKCTEADAYRKAFPQDFSGIVLDDAMPAPDPDAPAAPQRARVDPDAIRARTVTATVVTPEPSPAGPDSPASAPAATQSPPPPADMAPAGEAKTAAQYLADRLAKLNIKNEADQADRCARILDITVRPLEDLTDTEATQVMKYLRNCKSARDVDALIAELTMQADTPEEGGTDE